MEASLYIHVPFCSGFCDYCDFYSVQAGDNDERFDLYSNFILNDIAEQINTFSITHVPSVYIGGGTPSLLGAERMRSLLSVLRRLPYEETAGGGEMSREITVEANPESADRAFMEACREGGATRLSLGVQTFHEDSRRAVHRAGDGRLLPGRLSLARELFGRSFSADLITGLPLQNEQTLRRDIESLVDYEPGHISLYSLSVEPGNVLLENRAARLPGREEADALWILGRDLLEISGYEQYEVSNFARPGRRSIHNTRYWRMKNWLGIGPAASGTIIDDEKGTGTRFTAAPDIDAWIAAHEGSSPACPAAREELDRPTLMRESMLMGFRFIDGPDTELFRRRFGLNIESVIPKTISLWRRAGRMRRDKTALTGEGLLFLNSFLIDAFDETPDNTCRA
jgi:oxygen-independent coproporphyrinogen-3 oxidase